MAIFRLKSQRRGSGKYENVKKARVISLAVTVPVIISLAGCRAGDQYADAHSDADSDACPGCRLFR